MCGKNFQIYGVHVPRKSLNLAIFTDFPLPTQNLPPSSYHHNLGKGKLLIPPGCIFFENLFSPTAERGEGNYDLLYQNLIRKYEDNLEH